MQAGLVFNGLATLAEQSYDLVWTLETVDEDNYSFSFNQVLSSEGQILEQSGGNGTYTRNQEGIYLLTFTDTQTSFQGEFDESTGVFNGSATQIDDPSVTGGFQLTASRY